VSDPADSLRLDKWLWQARFFKTRSLSAKAVAAGVRINGQRTEKPSAAVRPGDVLTFAQGPRIRIVEIVALGARRGPAAEAQTLYADRSPPPPPRPDAAPAPEKAPDSRDRRAIRRLRRSDT
jgi:ribosome-associated heat shock protein Hsp15